MRFSVFGVLDASADTQWIRVMPIRPLATTAPDSFGISVSLEHLESGRVVALRDSLLRFSRANAEIGSEVLWIHDFWTTEPVEPGAAYRLTVLREGGRPAEAVVEIPENFPVEVSVVAYPGRYDFDSLRIIGPPHVPFIAAYTYFFDRCGSAFDSIRYGGRTSAQGYAVVEIQVEPVARENCGPAGVERRELRIAASAAPWPSQGTYTPWGLSPTERASNVTNAVGFFGGVLTRVVPYEACAYQGPEDVPQPSHCTFRYDERSATLTGTVVETRCGDGSIDSVTVELHEAVDSTHVVLVRRALSARTGAFEIGALEPGKTYALKVRAKPISLGGGVYLDIYSILTDTLAFAPGERRSYPVGLRRLTPCDQKP